MSQIIDSYSEGYRSNYVALSDTTTTHRHKASQSFTGDGRPLDIVKFFLRKYGSPTGSAYAKVYAHTGVFGDSSLPTGAALATSGSYEVSDLTTGYQLITFTFTGGDKITLVDGTKYVVTCEYENGAYGVDYIAVGLDDVGSLHGGNAGKYTTDDGWTTFATYDLCFYVYGDEISSESPSLSPSVSESPSTSPSISPSVSESPSESPSVSPMYSH